MTTQTTLHEDPLGLKAHYETVIGEPWSVLEKSVRSNPRNRWFFRTFDDIGMREELEAECLAALPWWRKLWGKTVTTDLPKEKRRRMRLLIGDLCECCEFNDSDAAILQNIYQAIDDFEKVKS